MPKLPPITPLTRHYLWTAAFRLTVFLLILGVYLYDKALLDFTAGGPLFWPLTLLWLVMLTAMLSQLNPRSRLTTGCHKQYPSAFEAVPNFDAAALKKTIRAQNIGAVKVAAVWLAVHAMVGWLYFNETLAVPELLLLAAFYYLCDLICVLFFCPFQTFLMKNRCCVNCRIFAWGSWMMATPLVFVAHIYSLSLVAASLLVLIVWEYRFSKYPERFWFGSNRHLQCGHCKEQLCRYKFPRSPRFRT